MLSAIDLLAAGTLDLKLAAFLMRTVRKGASILGCAGPGGTGKTTLMGALLCFLPANALIKVVEKHQPFSWYEEQSDPQAPTWFLCHELGPGSWYSYLWGEGARTFLSMPNQGRFCATTVHADNLGELRRLVQGREIGLSPQDFARLDLVLFIRALRVQGTGRWQRRVTEVCLGTGDPKETHRSVCRWDPTTDGFIWNLEEAESSSTGPTGEKMVSRPWLSGRRPQPDKKASKADHIPAKLQPYYAFLRNLQAQRITALEDVRSEVLRFYHSSPPTLTP
jgi:hypothetical protein